MGAIETLVVWENLDITRYVLKNSSSRETVVTHLNKEQETDQSNFRDPDTNAELEVQDKLSLLEWFANEYRRFGCSLEFVTNKSQEQLPTSQIPVQKLSEKACIGVQGMSLSPDSSAHVLSEIFLGALKMENLNLLRFHHALVQSRSVPE
ncbi:hypothetical protein K7X08_021821 [Anisodus acutangulus]|uniref:eRF1 domain-containing protein n=1 Tax=Anisodus acutangulus TaxID=402998 RepID=A0A9Q1L4R1_9SOLA|nr:hypothetical protein K7X08_021821 [Anisodus acutangulus]